MADLFADLNLPQSSYLPPEYSRQAFEQANIGRARAEEESMRRFLEGINAMGKLYTGSALRGGIEQVLGPSIERQQQLLGGMALQGMEAQRGERLAGEERGYQSEQARIGRDWQAQQNELNRQAQLRQLQMEMDFRRQMSKKNKSFLKSFEQKALDVLPNMVFQGAGAALGGLPGMLFSSAAPTALGGSYGGDMDTGYGTNMFGRNLGYGSNEYGR